MTAPLKKLFSLLLVSCLFSVGCEDTDVGMVTQAGLDAFRAATLSDEDVKRLSISISRESDHKHTVAPSHSPYARRLQRLVENSSAASGQSFNFKVYLSPDINAFAMADGSIRIYSGLMDMMDDGELLFVIGHEMGHVAERHVKEKIMLAYAGSAVRKAIASQQNQVGSLARSGIGALAESLLNAQFSQQEEREADDYGVAFLKERGYDKGPAISALRKLATLGSGYSFLSSHPAPEARAERLLKKTSSPHPAEKRSIVKRIIDWLKSLWTYGTANQRRETDLFLFASK